MKEAFKVYYAVIFTSILKDTEDQSYSIMADKMEELAKQQQGFLGIESARSVTGITVSYWESEEAIYRWKENIEHQKAQSLGIKKWYESYRIRIAKVEREYTFKSD